MHPSGDGSAAALTARRVRARVALGLLASLSLVLACSPTETRFGAPLELTDVLSVEQSIARQTQLLDQDVALAGRIETVCPVAGCWCVLRDGVHELHVTLGSFSLPAAAEGRRCRVEGTLVERDGRLTLLARGLELLDDG